MSGSTQNWSIPTDARQHFQQTEKRLGWEERRPRITKASDIMGPGLGPYATTLDDLDGETAAFNGMWFIPVGTPGSPDSVKNLIGYTVADPLNGGMQYASTFEGADAPFDHYCRGFEYAVTGGTRFYSAWETIGGAAPPPAAVVQAGSVDILSVVDGVGTAAVTFTTPFVAAPSVVATPSSTANASINVRAHVSGVTTTGFTMRHIQSGGSATTRTLMWIATEKTQ